MMGLEQIVSTFLVVAPILVLLAVGGVIALKSGVSQVSTGQDFLKVACNFSQLLLRVAVYIVVLLLVQYFIGLRPSLGW